MNQSDVKTVNNIHYQFENYGITFGFTHGPGEFMSAILQLPNTPDSQHSIDGVDFDRDNEKHVEIFEALKDYYYSRFKDTECAKASIKMQSPVFHVEPIDNYYAVFCEDGQSALLKEGRASDYYHVFYFDNLDPHEMGNESELIDCAKNKYFKKLSANLSETLTNWNIKWEKNGFPTAGNYAGNERGMAENCPDEAVGDFMRTEFGNNWQENDIAMAFYEDLACDLRQAAVYDAIERLENNQENNPEMSP